MVPLTYLPGSRTPTPESKAEYDAVADLRREWREAALHVFVANDDWDLRQRILPWLRFDAQHYPDELRQWWKTPPVSAGRTQTRTSGTEWNTNSDLAGTRKSGCHFL